MFIAGVQRLENTSVVTAEIKAFACFFSVCYGNEIWEQLQKNLDKPEVCRGLQEKGKVSQASLCQDVLTALEPPCSVLLLLCPWTLILSPKDSTESAPGQAQLLNIRLSSMGQ